jgi:N-acetylglucosamine kinase-like BadF-type ATPase
MPTSRSIARTWVSGTIERVGPTMTYILGVDGGGSKTLAVVADETGEVLGIGRTGSANHQVLGLDRAMEQVRRAVERAFALSGVQPEEVEAAAYCIAGADLPEDFELLSPALAELRLAQRMHLENDIVASLRSGSDRRDVVVVGWGSGVNALGRNAAGREIRLPALGWISGDWGGGGDLGREAIFLVVRGDDGRGRPTALREPVLAAFDVSDVDALIRKLYFGERERVATHSLAPIVFAAANAGDGVARDLVERSGIEVADTALALLRRLDILDVPTDVVLAGSIFKTELPLLIDTVRCRLNEAAPLARLVRPEVEPVLGALFCGFDLVKREVHGAIRARAKVSYERFAGRAAEEVGT